MTDEEKAAVLQFMGVAYGDAHKQDQMIVGQSGQLQPNSHIMKEKFEEVLRSPTVPRQQNAPAPVPDQGPVAMPSQDQQPAPAPVQVIDVQQAAEELAMTESPAPELPVGQNTNQLEFDLTEPSKLDKLIDLTNQQNLLLREISLKLDNAKGAKNTKKR
jgi:hypothetical protein